MASSPLRINFIVFFFRFLWSFYSIGVVRQGCAYVGESGRRVLYSFSACQIGNKMWTIYLGSALSVYTQRLLWWWMSKLLGQCLISGCFVNHFQWKNSAELYLRIEVDKSCTSCFIISCSKYLQQAVAEWLRWRTSDSR